MRFAREVISAAVLIAATAPAADAAPSPSPDCPALFAGRSMVLSLDAMPAPVAAALNAKFAAGGAVGDRKLIAGRDADWEPTDVVSPGLPLPGRRFIGGGRRGSAWFVWYERGGIAHIFFAAVFDLPEGSPTPNRIAHRMTRLDDLCHITLELLDAASTDSPDSNDW